LKERYSHNTDAGCARGRDRAGIGDATASAGIAEYGDTANENAVTVAYRNDLAAVADAAQENGIIAGKDSALSREDCALIGNAAGKGGDADSADSRCLCADEGARGIDDAAGKIADVVYEDRAAHTAGRDLAVVGDAARESGDLRDDDAVGGCDDRTRIADAAGKGGHRGDEDPVVLCRDRASIADAAGERRCIFNVDGNGASGSDANAAVSADLDAARDDAAVNQNPGARRENDAAIDDPALDGAGGDADPVWEAEISLVLVMPAVRNVLLTTTIPPLPIVPALVTPPLKLVPLTSISLVTPVLVWGNGPL
jgi:hypothetical protein